MTVNSSPPLKNVRFPGNIKTEYSDSASRRCALAKGAREGVRTCYGDEVPEEERVQGAQAARHENKTCDRLMAPVEQ